MSAARRTARAVWRPTGRRARAGRGRAAAPRLRGLMCIPEPTEDTALLRARFAVLRRLRDELVAAGLALDTLSMSLIRDIPSRRSPRAPPSSASVPAIFSERVEARFHPGCGRFRLTRARVRRQMECRSRRRSLFSAASNMASLSVGGMIERGFCGRRHPGRRTRRCGACRARRPLRRARGGGLRAVARSPATMLGGEATAADEGRARRSPGNSPTQLVISIAASRLADLGRWLGAPMRAHPPGAPPATGADRRWRHRSVPTPRWTPPSDARPPSASSAVGNAV